MGVNLKNINRSRDGNHNNNRSVFIRKYAVLKMNKNLSWQLVGCSQPVIGLYLFLENAGLHRYSDRTGVFLWDWDRKFVFLCAQDGTGVLLWG